MSDDSSLRPTGQGNDTTMYRPTTEGGLEASPRSTEDYRNKLRSRRWNAAPLKNSEAEKTDPRIAVAAIVLLSAFTLVTLVIGYGSGFWG
jgi:hypothetical protein